jgi:tRNA (cytidine32/uridine32-2'-O)-methyltransferase
MTDPNSHPVSHAALASSAPPLDGAAAAQRIRFVLVRPSHPGNIGAAARAIRTMGFTRLHLVAPHKFPHADATALAAGADDVLANAVVTETLQEALRDCTFALGCTARQRAVPLEELSPRVAAARALQAGAQGEVAVVFGNERTGLENDELMCCHAAVHIASAADFPSLNLAQAVQVLAYELRTLALAQLPVADAHGKSEPLATSADLEHFFGHLAQMLDDIDFHKGRSPRTIMNRLRRLFLRTGLEQREVRILRGIFDDAQRMSRLAKGAAEKSSGG